MASDPMTVSPESLTLVDHGLFPSGMVSAVLTGRGDSVEHG